MQRSLFILPTTHLCLSQDQLAELAFPSGRWAALLRMMPTGSHPHRRMQQVGAWALWLRLSHEAREVNVGGAAQARIQPTSGFLLLHFASRTHGHRHARQYSMRRTPQALNAKTQTIQALPRYIPGHRIPPGIMQVRSFEPVHHACVDTT